MLFSQDNLYYSGHLPLEGERGRGGEGERGRGGEGERVSD